MNNDSYWIDDADYEYLFLLVYPSIVVMKIFIENALSSSKFS